MTFTEKGSQKVALEPTGPLPSADSSSIVLSTEQFRDLLNKLEKNNEQLILLNQHLEIIIQKL